MKDQFEGLKIVVVAEGISLHGQSNPYELDGGGESERSEACSGPAQIEDYLLLEAAVFVIVFHAEVIEDREVLNGDSYTMAAEGNTRATLSMLPLQRLTIPCFRTTVERSAKKSR